MKITPKQYVRVLEAILEKYPNDVKKAVEQFVFVLRRNRHTALFNKIAMAFSEYLEKKEGREAIRLQTAQKFSEKIQAELEEKIRISRKSPSAKILWKENPSLVGGMRVRVGERGQDESIARRLRSLRDCLKNEL